MKYIIANNLISGTYDTYEILDFFVNKGIKCVSGKLQKLNIMETGIINSTIENFTIADAVEIIVDPAWTARPLDFEITNPLTWGELSWDDIPKIQNPDKLYASIIIESNNTERYIIDYFQQFGVVPMGGEVV